MWAMVHRWNLCPAGECDSDPHHFWSVEVPRHSGQSMPQYSNSKCCLRTYSEPDRGKSLCTSGGASVLLGSPQRIQHCCVKLQLPFIAAGTLTKISSWKKCRFSLTSPHQTSVWNEPCLTVHAGGWAHPVQDRVEPGCCLPENSRLPLGKAHKLWQHAQKNGAPHKRSQTNKQTNEKCRQKRALKQASLFGPEADYLGFFLPWGPPGSNTQGQRSLPTLLPCGCIS